MEMDGDLYLELIFQANNTMKRQISSGLEKCMAFWPDKICITRKRVLNNAIEFLYATGPIFQILISTFGLKNQQLIPNRIIQQLKHCRHPVSLIKTISIGFISLSSPFHLQLNFSPSTTSHLHSCRFYDLISFPAIELKQKPTTKYYEIASKLRCFIEMNKLFLSFEPL